MDSVTRCQNRKAKQKVVSVIENVCEEICNHYCKWPEQYGADEYEDLLEEKCNFCPLDRLC